MATPVRLRIDGDASGATSAINTTKRGLQGLDSQAGKVTTSASKMGGAFRTALTSVALQSAIRGTVGFLVSSTKAYGELNDAISANQVAFGKDSNAIQAWARESGPALMMTSRQALEATTGFKLLLGNLGLAPKEANAASKTLTALAADMASFRGTSVQDAIDSLTSSVKGEMDPIEKYGVTLNEATIKAKALEMGLYSGKGALDSAAKAQAVYAAILEQTSKIQGDAERTSGSYANQMRRLSVNWLTFKESVGKALVPIVEKYAPSVNTFLESMNSQGGISGMTTAFDNVGAAVDRIVAKGQELWKTFSSAAGKEGGDALRQAYESVAKAAETMAGWAGQAVAAFNNMSPETKDNIALLIAAGGALAIAGKSPVIQLGLSLVGETLTRITGEAVSFAISNMFPTAMRIAGQPIRVVGNIGSGGGAGSGGTTGGAKAQFASGLKMFGAAALASVVLPYLIETLPLPPGAKQQVADIASIASYGAMGLAAFGPIGGVGGVIYGALKALVARDKGHDDRLAGLRATSDYLRGRTSDLSAEDRRIWRDSAQQAAKLGALSASDYAQTQRLGAQQRSLETHAGSIGTLFGSSAEHARAISGLRGGVASLGVTASIQAWRLGQEEQLRRTGDQTSLNKIQWIQNNFSSMVGAWFAAHGGGGGAYASSPGGRAAVNVVVQDRRLADLIDVEVGTVSALTAHQQVRRHRWA